MAGHFDSGQAEPLPFRTDSEVELSFPRFSLNAVRKNPMFVDPDVVEELIDSLRLAGLSYNFV